MLQKKWLAALVLALPLLGYSQNHPPSVNNIRFAQRTDGTFLVDIYYSLADAENNLQTVSMEASIDDGVSWNYPCASVSGDIGAKIAPGDKHIIWDLLADHPQETSADFKIKIIAEEKQTITVDWVQIPAGNYTYGDSNKTRTMDYDYYIMKFPVTNRQYLQFLNSAKAAGLITIDGNKVLGHYSGDAMYAAGTYIFYQLGETLEDYKVGFIHYNGKEFVLSPNDTYLDHPVITVTWFGAWAFCDYYGFRLPKEEEWEKAARGVKVTQFPWGNDFDGSRLNFFNSGDPFTDGTTPVGYYNGVTHNGFVTKDSPSPHGVYDMTGNVAQWTDSFFSNESPDNRERVFRGGAWMYSTIDVFTVFFRLSYVPENRGYGLGFRCAKNPSTGQADAGIGISERGKLSLAYPMAPTLLSPANETVDQSLKVNLAWRRTSQTMSYRLQVSPKSDFSELTVSRENIQDSLATVEVTGNATRYYWRICGVNLVGVGPYSEAWNFTTIPAAPTVPSLLSPADGTINVALTTTVSWNPSDRATSYQLQVSAQSDLSAPVTDKTDITQTSFELVNLASQTKFYWRVRAKNSGGLGEWSKVNSFTTIPAPPAIPTLLLPADAAQNVPLNTSLSWNTSARALTYQLQLSTLVDFSTLLTDAGDVADTKYAPSGLVNQTKYYWRVRSHNIAGTSDWSNVASFTTVVSAPLLPALVSPADSAKNVPITASLAWSITEKATAYHLQVSTLSDFSNPLIDKNDITTTSYAPPGLTHSTLYFWRVRALNVGGVSEWSSARCFTTITSAPAIPTLLTPAPGSENVDWNITLTWSAVAGAIDYDLQLSNHPDFSMLILNHFGLAETSFPVSELSSLTKYYWRVRSRNIGGQSDWASAGSFTTRMAAPNAPMLVSPSNNSQQIALSPTLTWKSMAFAQKYHLQVAKHNDFSNLLLEKKDLADTLYTLADLDYGTIYYWRVAAVNSTGSSDFPTAWSFKTAPRVLAAPILVSPHQDAKTATIDVEFKWQAVDRAVSYHIELAMVPDFSTLVHDRSLITDTTVVIVSLQYSQIYYWRVAAVNADGEGPFSNSRSFTTGALGVSNVSLSTQPTEFALLPNYPNPFNPETTITFQIPANQNQSVQLNVYNSSGQFITCLFNGAPSAGTYAVKWNGKNYAGENVGTGIYLYRLETANFSRTAKMLYVR